LNIEHGISNEEVLFPLPDSFDIRHSMFDIPREAWQAYYSRIADRRRIGQTIMIEFVFGKKVSESKADFSRVDEKNAFLHEKRTGNSIGVLAPLSLSGNFTSCSCEFMLKAQA
jgi:hypothetical protein